MILCTLGARDFSCTVSGFCQVFIVSHAFFLPASPLVTSAYGRTCVGLRPAPKIPAAREKKLLVPRVDSLSSFLTTGPLWVIVKFAENGCLLDYVRKRQSQPDYINTGEESDESKALSNLEIIRLAHGIAKGMTHLAKVKVCL